MFLLSWSGVAGIGALLLAGAVVWRHVHRSRIQTRIAAALGHMDPDRRRAGILVATELGLRAHAGLLVDHLTREDDPDVLATLADGVLRNAWEPADRPAMLRLRLWAHEHRTLNPATASPAAPARTGAGLHATGDATPARAWAPVPSTAVLAPAPQARRQASVSQASVARADVTHAAARRPASSRRSPSPPASSRRSPSQPARSRPTVTQRPHGPDVDGDAVTEIVPVVGNPAPPQPRRDIKIPAMRPPSERRETRRGRHEKAVAVAPVNPVNLVVPADAGIYRDDDTAPMAAVPARVGSTSTRLVPVDPLRQARAEKSRRSNGTTFGNVPARSPRWARSKNNVDKEMDREMHTDKDRDSGRSRHGQRAHLIVAAPLADQESRRARHRAEPGRTSFVRSAG